LACSAFVGATVTLATQNADASIIYSGLQNLSVPTTNGQGGLYIDMELLTHFNAITNGSQPGGGPGPLVSTWDFNFYQRRTTSANGPGSLRFYYNTGTGNMFSTNPIRYSFGVVSNGQNAALPSGTLVDGTSPFGQVSGLTNFYGTTAFMGLEFRNNANTTNFFGWLRLTGGPGVAPTPGFPATVVDWAYDNTGAGIRVGAVPEPGTLALGCLAAGAAGMIAWRKRKKA
ncbi:MAG: PEP-CTERM sorting domain-containing protein, partial [Limisphaerales bacterium]